jgi:signal transduction histidine kinase
VSGGATETIPAAQLDARVRHEFERELADENYRLLTRSAIIFGIIYVLWGAFDYFLVPDRWKEFLLFRLLAAGANTIIVAFAMAPSLRRFSAKAFWLWFFVWGICVCPMLPGTGEAFLAYVLGLIIVFWGIGVIPYWSGFSAFSVLGAIFVPATYAISITPASTPDLFSAHFVLATAVVLATVSAQFRYQLIRSEFHARKGLEREQRKTQELREADKTRALELAEALERAQEVDRLKSEFFANISHELRTPLTLILSPVDELLGKLQPSAERDALKVVRRNATRLLRMIDDLLDLARLEAGGLRLRVVQVDVSSLAQRVSENVSHAAAAKGVDLTFKSTGASPDMFGDPHRLEIILTNLVGNAMKFTPEGGRIAVSAFHNPAGASIEVTDTGPGIPREERDRIFDRFHQTETSERRRQGGVGIGLALARELAQLHGGSLTVESDLGRGSTFTLFLKSGNEHFHTQIVERRQVQMDQHPGRRVEDRDTAVHTRSMEDATVEMRQSQRPPERVLLDRGRVPRILVAEDEPDLRGFIVGVLRDRYEVDAAKDGSEALELIKQHRPDLVLTDIMMPGTSGLDLCAAIKSDPSLRHIPVILLTARGESEAALEGYEAGADDFVSKPFHTRVLQARIRAHLKMRGLSLQLADQARLASAGTLAAGLAHEVKNPLNAAVNAAKVLDSGGSSRVSNEKLMEVIIDALGRIDSVVSALDAHARPADGDDLTPCNVRDAVQSTLNLLEHKLKNRVTVHQDYETTGDVFAPARAFNQVLLNLVDNSIRSGAENIWIELRQLDKQVSVAVADDGPGVPPDVVHRIFDPFFTTRVEGEGTGLGLHLSRRIAQECGGELRYEPRPGGGARFVMEIPAMEQAA